MEALYVNKVILETEIVGCERDRAMRWNKGGGSLKSVVLLFVTTR